MTDASLDQPGLDAPPDSEADVDPTPGDPTPGNPSGDPSGGAALSPIQPEVVALLAAIDNGPRRRRWPTLLLAAVVGGAVALGVNAVLDRRAEVVGPEREEIALTVAPVEQRDLTEEIEWAATLGYGEVAAVTGSGGVVTEVASIGDRLERGDMVVRVDAQPVVVLYGERPMWRSLRQGDEGADVRQLEYNLVALGYDPDGTLDVDEVFTSNTEAMVERWQEDLGVEVTGVVDPAGIVVTAGPVLVESVAEVGAVATGPIAQLGVTRVVDGVTSPGAGVVTDLAPVGTVVESGTVLYRFDGVDVVALPTEQDVAAAETAAGDGADVLFVVLAEGLIVDPHLLDDGASVPASHPVLLASASQLSTELVVSVADAEEFEVGQRVEVELPDETVVDGAVVDVGPVVPGNGTNDPTVTVRVAVVDVDDDVAIGPVTVFSIGQTIEGAFVIPTRALLSLAEGGFAVERVRPDGSTELVGVELGTFDEGAVEVINPELAPGDELVVPA